MDCEMDSYHIAWRHEMLREQIHYIKCDLARHLSRDDIQVYNTTNPSLEGHLHSKLNSQTPDTSSSTTNIGGPQAALHKLFHDGQPTHDTCSNLSYSQSFATYYCGDRATSSVWLFADPLALIGLSERNETCRWGPDYTTPRRISVSNGWQVPEIKLSALAEKLLAESEDILRKYAEIQAYIFDFTNCAASDLENKCEQMISLEFKLMKSKMDLTFNLKRIPCCWFDEAPVVRILATLLILASDEELLQSTQIAPTLAYDCSATAVTTQISSIKPKRKVKAFFCNLEEYNSFFNRLKSRSGWFDQNQTSNAIIIPLTDNDDQKPLIKALVNTSMDWWFGRVTKKLKVRCHNNESDDSKVIYASPLAALLKLDAIKTHERSYCILFVREVSTPDSTLILKGPDGTSIEVPRLTHDESIQPVDLTEILTSWTQTEHAQDLRLRLGRLLSWYAQHNVGNAFQSAMALVAETCFQLPMPKILNSGKLFGGYRWAKQEESEPQIRIDSKEPVEPSATLEDQLESPDGGAIKAILNHLVLSYQTPAGLLHPGSNVSLNSNCDLEIDLKNSLMRGSYSCNEADGLARIAIAFGMVKLDPFALLFGAFWSLGTLAYLQGQACLQAGISAWMAMEAGYTMFDICGFWTTYKHDELPYDCDFSKKFRTYAERPLDLATSGKISINDVEHLKKIDYKQVFQNLKTALNMPEVSLEDLKGWSLPGWYILAIKHKFSGTMLSGPIPIIGWSRHTQNPCYSFTLDQSASQLMALSICHDATLVSYSRITRECRAESILCDFYFHKSVFATCGQQFISTQRKPILVDLETSAVILDHLQDDSNRIVLSKWDMNLKYPRY